MEVDLIIPQDSWEAVREKLVEPDNASEFYKVTMTLGQLLEGDFFREYIKIGIPNRPGQHSMGSRINNYVAQEMF